MRGDKKRVLKQAVGARVRALRKERDWKQQALAHMIGDRSHSTISDIENGYRMPSPATLHALAEVFDVSVGYLLGTPASEHESNSDVRLLKAQVRSVVDEIRACLDRAATLLTTLF